MGNVLVEFYFFFIKFTVGGINIHKNILMIIWAHMFQCLSTVMLKQNTFNHFQGAFVPSCNRVSEQRSFSSVIVCEEKKGLS